MKNQIFTLILSLPVAFLFAQKPVSNVLPTNPVLKAEVAKPTAPDPLLLKEPVYDFGKIPQGKPVTHVFEVVNNGNMPLNLVNVQASCGCTTPIWDKDTPIPPGGTGKITVGYNGAGEGAFSKNITINYGESLSKQIIIKGEVWKTPATSAPVNTGLEDLKD